MEESGVGDQGKEKSTGRGRKKEDRALRQGEERVDLPFGGCPLLSLKLTNIFVF